jgi:hypothetical protein
LEVLFWNFTDFGTPPRRGSLGQIIRILRSFQMRSASGGEPWLTHGSAV